MRESGTKYRTAHGFSAIKDGIKVVDLDTAEPPLRKPPWLRVRIGRNGEYANVLRTVREHRLATVCEESHCPNIGECWNAGTATLMLMGEVCTRACRFCAVDTGNPQGWLDDEEPDNAAESVALMGLKYVVLTSVDRDDLSDGGAGHYAACVRAIKARCPGNHRRSADPRLPGRHGRSGRGRGFRRRRVCAEPGDRAAADPCGSRSARGLRADPRCACPRGIAGSRSPRAA